MENSYRRHDMSDAMWEILKPYTIGNKGTWGGNAKDTRQFLNGVFWILRTGAPWRDLPPEYGKWNTVQRRFCRWRDKGIWEKMLEAVIQEPDFEWLMIDASHIKVHPHASGEYNYKSLDELYNAQQVDGIVLERDWEKIKELQCTDFDILGLWD